MCPLEPNVSFRAKGVLAVGVYAPHGVPSREAIQGTAPEALK